jgi:anti-sigma-K factor RskA
MNEPHTPEMFDELAAEYALGVLEGEERLRAQALQRADPRFAAAVATWEARLAPLLREVAEVEPSAKLWHRIDGRIAANDGSDRRSAQRWRAATFAIGAVAVALAVALVVAPTHAPPASPPPAAQRELPRYVAQLADPAGKPLLTIGYDGASGAMRVTAALPDRDRVPELWIIPAGGAPHSLGALTPAGSTRVLTPAALQRFVREGATLAVTFEDPEGIPHAAPSGAIVASGTLTTL